MIAETLTQFARSRPGLKSRLGALAARLGYDGADWMRIVMYRRCFEFVRSLDPEALDVLEISAGPQWAREFAFRSYTPTRYPDFDICARPLAARFDLIIADQLFEHLRWPFRAGRNVLAMLRPGGVFIITVPFLVRVHASPIDCTRWTADGLNYFLQECGFDETGITTDSWGNRACLRANLTRWRKRPPFGSLANEPDFPVAVWGFARRLPQRDAGDRSEH